MYHRFVTNLAEKDTSLCVLSNVLWVTWKVNGIKIERPKSWFITLVNS